MSVGVPGKELGQQLAGSGSKSPSSIGPTQSRDALWSRGERSMMAG
jgi:hypothetical protein